MNAPIIMTYNDQLAAKAGGGDYLSEGGAHICKITQAKYVRAKTGSAGIEFSLETEGGQKANFVNVYYAKASAVQGQPGEPIKSGSNILHAFMGLLQLRQMTSVKQGDQYLCPEFTGKRIGLFLQKKLLTKTDGSEGYGFEISVPFNPVDSKTMREIQENKPAQTIERMSRTYADRDERATTKAATNSGASFGDSFDSGAGGFYNDDPGH